jgi:hypothetical protein
VEEAVEPQPYRSIVYQETVKRLSEAKSTEEVLKALEWARQHGLEVAHTPAFYQGGVGRMVVGAVEPYSGEVFQAAYAFKGAGEANILAKQTATVDLSKHIEEAVKQGYTRLQVELSPERCFPRLDVVLKGVKLPEPPPPPPEPPKDPFAVAKQLLETPITPGRPVDAAALEFQRWFWKYAPQLAQRYHVKESGPIGTPEAEEILKKMAEAGELKLEEGMLKVEFKQPEKSEVPAPSPMESFLSGLTGVLRGVWPLNLLVPEAGRSALREISAVSAPQLMGEAVARGELQPGKGYVGPSNPLEGTVFDPKVQEAWRRNLASAAAEVAGIAAGSFGALGVMELEGIATAKIAAKGAQLHEKALQEYAKAVNAENLPKMIGWRTVETFTAPLRGLNWALEKMSLVTQEKRVYAPEEVKLYTVQYKDVAGAAWEFEKAMKDITAKWVEGSPAPRITSLEAPFYKVPVGFKEAGATLKVGELPFSLYPSTLKMGGGGVEALAAFTREGGGFILKGFPESPLPLASKQTLKVIFPWEKVAEEAGKAASSVLSGGGAAAGGGGGASLLSSLKLTLGGGGVPGVTLKTVASVKPLPVAVPAIPSLTQAPKLEQKLESKSIALPKVELEVEEKAKGSAASFITSIPLPEPKLKPPESIPFPSVKTVSRSVARTALFPALSPAEAEHIGEKAAAALSVLTVPRLAQALAAPSPTPPSQAGGGEKGRLPGLPYFSPPPASVIYRSPEWRLGKYWRVDWFAEGLKLDFRLGKLARSLAPKTVKVKQVDWLKPLKPKPRAKPKPRRKASSERSTRKAAKRRKAKRKVKAA